MRFVQIALRVFVLGGFSPAAFTAGNPRDEVTVSRHQSPITSHRRVVVLVWDGMRPDFVTEQNCPALCELARGGVNFAHHHSVYPSATEVNGTAISTGGYPAHDGIVGNHEYRPEIDALKPVRTESPETARREDELTHGHYVRLPTLAE